MKNIITSIQTYVCRAILVATVFLFVYIVVPAFATTTDYQTDFGIAVASAQSYDYGSDGYSFGSVGAGCCDYTSYSAPSYSYDYGSDGYSFGSVGAGCCDSPIVYAQSTYDYGSDGYSFGSVGAGCCDTVYTPPVYSEYVPPVYDVPCIPQDNYGYVDSYVPQYSYSSYSSPSYSSPSYSSPSYSSSYPSYNYPTQTVRQRPVCTFFADDTRIKKGESTRLKWDTSRADNVDINQGIGDVADDGSRSISPNRTTTYTLIAQGDGGTVTCNETVFVDEPRNDLSCDSFTVSDSRVEKGDKVKLAWRTTGANDVTINNGVGDVSKDGDKEVTVRDDTTYTLTARNGNDSVTCHVSVDIEKKNDKNVRCDAFTVSDSRVEKGDKVMLTWRTTDADSVRIDHGVGSVADDGEERVTINDDTTFMLTARIGNDSVTCHVSVDIEKKNDKNVRCDAFTVSDSRVEKGDKVMLTWRTTDADSVRIDHGVGSVADDGEERVTINDDTTFTLTARNGNDDDTCKVKVSVDEHKKNNSSTLRCELTASDTKIASGAEVKLSWNNRGADRVALKDNHGNGIADSKDDKGIDEDKDSVKVHPKKDTEYTLTAYDGNKKKTCTIEVRVGDTNITSIRGQGTIPLSYTPYTGFDAGPTLTFIFYGAIVLWGLFVGYALVLKKKAALELGHGVVGGVHAGIVASTATAHIPVAPVYDSVIPANLPIVEDTSAIIGTLETDTLRILEERANAQSVLISSDALRLIESQNGTHEEQAATLDRVIALAKAQYPKENGWIVVNKEKIISLLG